MKMAEKLLSGKPSKSCSMMFILQVVSFKLVFSQKKTFLVQMNVGIIVFWRPYVEVLMTLMTWLLPQIWCLTSLRCCHNVSTHCYDLPNHVNIVQLINLIIFLRVDAIKTEEKKWQFIKQSVLYHLSWNKRM